MRSTQDLIGELRQASQGAALTLLVVAFENTCKTISAELTDYDALMELNNLVLDGGSPVGIVRCRLEGKRVFLEARPLQENLDDPEVARILDEVTDRVRDKLR